MDASLPHWKWTPTPYEGVLPKSFSSKVKQHASRVVVKYQGVRRRMWGVCWWMCSGLVPAKQSWAFSIPTCLGIASADHCCIQHHKETEFIFFLLKHTLILDSTFSFHFLLPPFIKKNTGILHEIFLIWLGWYKVLVVSGLVGFVLFCCGFFCRQWGRMSHLSFSTVTLSRAYSE